MEPIFSDVLPFALGVAISPVPIIAAILMLMSPKAKTTSLAFALGWVVGVSVAVVVFTLLGSLLPERDSEAGSVARGVLKFVLAALLLLLAVRTFRRRPRDGEAAAMPKWMSGIEQMTAVKAGGMALLLAAANPKNLVMAASAGIALGQTATSGAAVAGTVTFIVIGVSTVVLPVVVYLCAAKRVAPLLAGLRDWLVNNNNVIMAVVLLFLAVSNIGKGIDAF